jgi:hypothetical protein
MDPDAVAFLNAQGNTNAKEKYALNRLVVDLKKAGIWTKCKAIYPFLGSTAAFHKWNLKDPRDLDAAFRLVFFGGWTHSSNGALPNGINGYANTYITPTDMGLNSAHLCVYSRTDNNGNYVDIGSTNLSALADDFQLISRFSGINYSILNAKNVIGFTQARSDGFSLVTRVNSSEFNYFRNTTKTTVLKTSDTRNSFNIYIGARNNANTAEFFSNRNYAFASIGDGLTDTEADNFYTIVQRFQTTLGRQV